MCAHPSCGSLPEFTLKNWPLGRPPETGWKIQALPPEASALQTEWSANPIVPENARSAWWTQLEFLAANGFSSSQITNQVVAEGARQWCSVNPESCTKRWRNRIPAQPETRFFPWAKTVWENFNNALHDEVADIPTALAVNVGILTGLISSPPPTGCQHCADHWQEVLAAHPVPENPTLQEAREWLHMVHNLTREGHEPVAFADIAAKFHWTTP